ncbi:hypothetical protein BDZ91DRAFT_664694 [Kalaharituber pfeilii]|nr:hypothetical protein BDZ91DRAFT_664694 [Kalaharituber pfeilii]
MEEFCKRSFDRRYKLYKHFKTSHQKNIPCPYAPQGCPRKFSTPKDRKRHVETVHDKLRPFACSVCGKRYGRKDNLRVHMKKVHKPE